MLNINSLLTEIFFYYFTWKIFWKYVDINLLSIEFSSRVWRNLLAVSPLCVKMAVIYSFESWLLNKVPIYACLNSNNWHNLAQMGNIELILSIY